MPAEMEAATQRLGMSNNGAIPVNMLPKIVIAVLFVGLTNLRADIVHVDADAFGVGTDISNAFPGITLSILTDGAYASSPTSSSVFARWSSVANSNVFGHNGAGAEAFFGYVTPTMNFASMRVDFTNPTNFVQVHVVPKDPYDPGAMFAYDAGGNLVGQCVTPGTSNAPEACQISSAQFNIAYVLIGGDPGQAGHVIYLDSLSYFDSAYYIEGQGVPEPLTLQLLGLGLAALVLSRIRR